MYKFHSRVRYSETNQKGNLTLEAMIDYFQDCTTFHSEDIGLGIHYLEQQNMIWVLSSWQIEVFRYPQMGDNICIGTAPYDFKGFMGYRNFLLETKEGEILAQANSIWILMDIKKNRPIRATEKMVEGYTLEERLNMEYAPRKIDIPVGLSNEKEEIMIKAHHLDTNLHVNNGQYIRMAMDYMEKKEEVTKLRAEYKKSAVLGDIIIPSIYKVDEKNIIALQNKKMETYAIVELF
ncbi:MAG TPA: acyl-ACP thioesterase domain-containing protein [Lachnospiraceae bacterium]|nr:acyl-ACP thioesterase domain-containing protein [Lachnospiraceae bacterium]